MRTQHVLDKGKTSKHWLLSRWAAEVVVKSHGLVMRPATPHFPVVETTGVLFPKLDLVIFEDSGFILSLSARANKPKPLIVMEIKLRSDMIGPCKKELTRTRRSRESKLESTS